MRRITIVSLAVVSAAVATVAACSNQDRETPTAPAAKAVSAATSSQTLATSPNAKPNQSSGFTTITRVKSGWVDVAPNAAAIAKATCPDGSVLIGGGYGFAVIGAASAPAVVRGSDSEPNTNTWSVSVMNYAPNAVQATFSATAYCAS